MRRRGYGGLRRAGGPKFRENAPLSRSQARGLCGVLRSHRKRCATRRNGSSAKKVVRLSRMAAGLRRTGRIAQAMGLERKIDAMVMGRPSLEKAAQIGLERGSFED